MSTSETQSAGQEPEPLELIADSDDLRDVVKTVDVIIPTARTLEAFAIPRILAPVDGLSEFLARRGIFEIGDGEYDGTILTMRRPELVHDKHLVRTELWHIQKVGGLYTVERNVSTSVDGSRPTLREREGGGALEERLGTDKVSKSETQKMIRRLTSTYHLGRAV